ncbi:hypothetical protein OH76DRAFT_1467492 [Lentinus brumalis]|uniref:XPG-I domain-containing protein n=1 Tax=Lentinus brumalis TaxID=2498619 RepID=A0A371CJJ8_9APHY|nr:hypothetical protein OH76DRAFT_1467492 [Polyporus brumalis]
MGVPGLWEVINKTGKSRSIANLAVTHGFEDNHNGTRTFRLGVDGCTTLPTAPLRTLFFRLAKLSRMPVSVLFVFDGRQRPKVKRGSKMGKSGTHGLAKGFRELIDLFGMDAREALGEAEAELAYLNRTGAIDAIITDDVDTLVFGALMILKNSSINLTGNKANPATDANGKPCELHVNVYTAEELARHPDVKLTRGGLVVFALVAGGDYGKGLKRCGPDAGHALARLGYGDNLLQAYEHRDAVDLPAFLAQWRLDVQQELRTNANKYMTNAYPSVAIPPDWPPLDQLEMYFDPLTSGRGGGTGGGPPRHRRPVDLPGIAHFCERQFTEWGYRSMILQRFNKNIVAGLVMTVLKAAALEADKREEDRRLRAGAAPGDARVRGLLKPAPHEAVGTPATLVKRCLMPPPKVTRGTRNDDRLAHIAAAFVNRGTPEPDEDERGYVEEVEDRHPLVVGITNQRQHVETDNMLEYRVEICPKQLHRIATSGIEGLNHPDPGAPADESDDEGEDDDRVPRAGQKTKKDNLVYWIPASIMREVHPDIVEEYEERIRSKNTKKAPARKRAAASQVQADGEDEPQPSQAQARSQTARAKPKAKGKGRAKGDEYDYVAFNPYASAASAKEDIDVFRESSLPLRNCGFVFNWPDPDDPDCLVVDSERDDLPTTVKYADIDALGVPMSTEYANTAPPARVRARARQSAAASTQSRSKENAPAASQNPRSNASASQPAKKRKRAAPQAQAEEPEEPWSEPEDDGRLAFMNPLIDSILGGPAGGGRKEKAKRGRKPRASASSASASAGPSRSSTQKDKGKGRADVGQASQAANKRRRTTLGGVGTGAGAASAFAQDLGEGPSTGSGSSQNRAGGSTSQSQGRADLFSGMYTLDDLMTSDSRSPSPSWSRPSSPAPPPPSSSMQAPSSSFSAHRPQSPARTLVPARRKSLPSTGDDVIELSSDSDDDVLGGAADLDDDEAFWSSLPGFNGEQSHYSLRKARESQQSLLDIDDAMDQDRDLEELNGLGVQKHAYASRSRSAAFDSSSSISAATRRSSGYHNLPIASSSQESALDSGEDFFKDVSVVRHLG